MEAIILAGGFGTRLRTCVSDVPKPLAPVSGKPFICYILDYLYANGVHRAIISTGYMAEKIRDTIGNKYRGMTVDYSHEVSPLGTGGGIKKALKKCVEEDIAVVNGDTFFDVNLFDMLDFHKKSGCPVTLAAKHIENAFRSGLLKIENNRLSGFLENGVAPSGYINGGIYFIKRTFLESISEEKFSFENAVLSNSDNSIGIFASDGYFIDIGIPDDYSRAEKESRRLISRRARKAVFLDRDGTVNKDTVHLFEKEKFEFLDGADEAIYLLKKSGYLVVIITNQAGIAKGLYKADDADKLHSHMDNLLCKKYSVVADRYYYCPHHPDAVIEDLRINCECRKPKAGLIFRAVEDFDKIGITINLSQSYTIGNRISDVLAGENAGTANNILVEKDEADEIGVASAVYDSLYEAVTNIKL